MRFCLKALSTVSLLRKKLKQLSIDFFEHRHNVNTSIKLRVKFQIIRLQRPTLNKKLDQTDRVKSRMNPAKNIEQLYLISDECDRNEINSGQDTTTPNTTRYNESIN